MALSRDEVLHVAKLAQLALSEDEIERLTEELGKILDAVGVVAELELTDVPPTSHPLDLVNVWDEDVPQAPLPLEEVFANAPAEEAGQFRVPAWRQ
jgi:aspartyl-tRNA(Asn)/glutamyl-tRNA(Gln) amidotransferase subunit C